MEPIDDSSPVPSPPGDPVEEIAARLNAILNTAVEGIITIDARGRMESANPAAQTIFGYAEQEMVGQNVSMLMPEPDRSRHDIYLANYLRTGEKKIIGIGREVFGRRKDGTIFPMDLSVSEVLLPGKKLFTGFVRDISERREQEMALLAMARSLEAKNKELESIVHVASHDLRAPLVNIQGFTRELEAACAHANELIAGCPIPNEAGQKLMATMRHEVNEPLSFIQASVTKIDRLLGGLLRLSRLGRAALCLENVDMNELMANVLATMEYQLKEVAATVMVAHLSACKGDAVQLNQVFSNLIDNAVKYRHPTRPLHLEISATSAGSEVHYQVRDNGRGIDPAHYAKAFEVFHRLEPGDSEGEGLGLTIAQRIIQRLDGRIWVDNSPGGGSTFHVSLPMASDLSP